MSKLRFDGKVAIVTGAGGGLGRTYALLLASRGAKVVVNDLGGATDGEGSSSAPAARVVAEIRKAGGQATANFDSVTDGDKIVKAAMGAYGRMDILVNNAGILRDRSFHKMGEKDWQLVVDVHLKGTFSVTRAAWGVMREQRYGRIVNVASAAGLYGNFGQGNYAAAKMGIVGLSSTLAREGAKRNIHVNVVAPVAGSRMTATVMPEDMVRALRPEYVAPLVAMLAHEECPDNGGIYEVGAGWFSKLRWQRTRGAVLPIRSGVPTPEALRDAWRQVVDFSDAEYPDSTQSSMGVVMSQVATLPEESGGAEPLQTAGPAVSSTADVFDMIAAALERQGPELVKQVKGSILFKLREPDSVHLLDLRSGNGSVTKGTGDEKASLTVSAKDGDFLRIAEGKLNPQTAFMQGKIKVKGNMGMAMKLDKVFKAARQGSKL